MELRQIQYFIQLYRDRNITKASKNLYISQQGLSKSVSRLEEELGFSLFDRHTSGVIPTKEANTLYRHFNKISNSYQELLLAIDIIRQNRLLRISAYHGFSLTCSHELLSGYRALFPESGFRYQENSNQDIPEQLSSLQADLAFLRAPIPDSLSSVHLLYREPVFLIMDESHPLVAADHTTAPDSVPEHTKGGIRLPDLHNQQLLLLDSMEDVNRAILHCAAHQGISCPVSDTVGINEFPLLLRGSSCVGFVSRRMYQNYQFPHLAFLPFAPEEYENHPELTMETHLVIPQGTTPDEEAQQFIDYITTTYTTFSWSVPC